VIFRVPFVLEKSLAVIHRIDLSATTALEPFSGQVGGYDKDFREPVVYDVEVPTGKVRETTRVELPAIKVPCQVEEVEFEKLRQLFAGDMPSTNMTLVLHRMDLHRMSLIDPTTGKPLINKNDRVSHLENFRTPGTVTLKFDDPGLYVFEIRPGSHGFGPDGYDLNIVYLSEKERAD
jgi:hypothetical protein